MGVSAQQDRPARRTRRTRASTPEELPPILCPRCGGPITPGQLVPPLFEAKLTQWVEHPVLSKPVMFRGIVGKEVSRTDLSVHEQLQQRAAMGGARERVQLEGFEALIARTLANAFVDHLRKEAAAHGVDVWTWLAGEAARGSDDNPERKD
jgi:hypothetical protein